MKYNAGDVLFHKNDTKKVAYLVLSGKIYVQPRKSEDRTNLLTQEPFLEDGRPYNDLGHTLPLDLPDPTPEPSQSVHVSESKTNMGEEELFVTTKPAGELRSRSQSKTSRTFQIGENGEGEEEEEPKTLNELAKDKYGRVLRVYEPGEFFGERCFESKKGKNEGAPKGRSASAIVIEDSELLMIGELDYAEIFYERKMLFDKRREETLLRIVPQFQQLRRDKLLPILYTAQYFSKKKGEYLYRQDTPSEKIYILIKGALSLRRTLQISKVAEEANHLAKIVRGFSLKKFPKNTFRKMVQA